MINENDIKISVIIATKNSMKSIGSCLRSLCVNKLDFRPGEIETIFIDYQSSDGTLEYIKASGENKVVQADKRGIPHAHNLGVEAARGNFIAFLNSDDEYGPGFLRRLYDIASADNSRPIVAYSTVKFIDRNGTELYRRYPPYYIEKLHSRNSIILHPNAIYPSSLMKLIKFEERSDLAPTDREQVLYVMRQCYSKRVKDVHYAFRIWSNSETVKRSKKSREVESICELMKNYFAKAYINLHETRKLKRLIMKLNGKNYWNG